MTQDMKLSSFDYDLPAEAIAKTPIYPRDDAKLLYLSNQIDDHQIKDLPRLLRAGDLLVVNDTKVIPAQLTAMRGVAKIGITLDRQLADGAWRVLLRNARRVRESDVLEIDDEFSAVARQIFADGSAILEFRTSDFLAALDRCGALALPPYIARPEGVLAEDAKDYQTIFAKYRGAVAAPTAGLHFTPELLNALAAHKINIVRVTLHVGAGTFLPVRSENIAEHKMHAEWGKLSDDAAHIINQTKARGGRIVPVGTTALRLLETAADQVGHVKAFSGETDIFITPGYQFKIADLLVTNFHLPKSTLLMLVSAFVGLDKIKFAYDHAINHGYRFYSYGDACLLERV